jgi:hypothetical protein
MWYKVLKFWIYSRIFILVFKLNILRTILTILIYYILFSLIKLLSILFSFYKLTLEVVPS